MRSLAAALGDPQNATPVIHVAGSKGKGSTATMLASILTAAGYRTGLYTRQAWARLAHPSLPQLCWRHGH